VILFARLQRAVCGNALEATGLKAEELRYLIEIQSPDCFRKSRRWLDGKALHLSPNCLFPQNSCGHELMRG
jgi:hypothetical protein